MRTVGTVPATRGKKRGDSFLLRNCSIVIVEDVIIGYAAKGGLGDR